MESAAENSVLSQALGLMDKQGPLQPQLSPENVVLVGLREASPAEAAVLKQSRITVFTMADIDALGMRDVMREAHQDRDHGHRPDSMSAIRRWRPRYPAGPTVPAA